MKSSRNALLVFTALLAISLAGKILSNQPTPPPDDALFAAAVEQALRSNGFSRIAREPFEKRTSIVATRGSCTVWAAESNAHGTFAEPIARRARRVGPLHFVFDGEIRDERPRYEPLLSFYWWRELRRIGVEAPRRPVVAVAASKGCDALSMDWSGLATLPS